MARPAKGEGKADPSFDGGRFSEPRRAARGRVPDRAMRHGIFCAPDLPGRDLSLWGRSVRDRRTGTRCGLRQGRRRARDPAVPARRFAGEPMLAARAGLVSGLPLMHRTSYIRLARVEEAAALSDL